MSEREPITGELREWMRDCCYPHNTDEDGNTVAPTWDGLCDRCDAIDAVHAGLERENAELLARVAELDNERENMHDGWVRLPVDADGVPWDVGDRDEDGDTVIELKLTLSGWCVVTDGGQFCCPGSYRHYHAPTVEDVLTEFGIDWEHESDCEDRAALLKEYAAKLRLAGDAE